MKHLILYFIGILGVCFITFPMEENELITWFHNTEKIAKNLESSGDPKALFYYGQLTDKSIPSSFKTPDPYRTTRVIQDDAYSKIKEAAQELEWEEKYEEALKIYNYAPATFAVSIKKIKEKITEKEKEIAKAVEIAEQIVEYNELAEEQPNLKLKWYGEILKQQLSCPPGAPELCRKAIDIQKQAMHTMLDAAHELKEKKEYGKALATYQFAGDFFVDYIEKLQKLMNILPELKRLTDKNEYVQAYKKLDELITEGITEAKTVKKEIQKQEAKQKKQSQPEKEQPESEELAEFYKKFGDFIANAKTYEKKKNMSQALQWYGKMLQEPIPSSLPPGAAKEVQEFQTEAFDKILKEADKLANEQKYKEALATYQLAPKSFYHNLAALEKRIAKLPDLIKEQEQSEQFAREILEQEELADKYLQEQLKKTLIQLTKKLRSLAHYITSQAPL